MRRDWEPEDVVAHWTLVEDDWRLVANKTGPSRLGFALVLKFFELEARFPRRADDLPPETVDHVAAQVKVEAGQIAVRVVGPDDRVPPGPDPRRPRLSRGFR